MHPSSPPPQSHTIYNANTNTRTSHGNKLSSHSRRTFKYQHGRQDHQQEHEIDIHHRHRNNNYDEEGEDHPMEDVGNHVGNCNNDGHPDIITSMKSQFGATNYSKKNISSSLQKRIRVNIGSSSHSPTSITIMPGTAIMLILATIISLTVILVYSHYRIKSLGTSQYRNNNNYHYF